MAVVGDVAETLVMSGQDFQHPFFFQLLQSRPETLQVVSAVVIGQGQEVQQPGRIVELGNTLHVDTSRRLPAKQKFQKGPEVLPNLFQGPEGQHPGVGPQRPNEQNEYIRNDFCQTCWKNSHVHEEISHWKTLFHIPSPQEERIKKESAESLLRKLLEKEEETLSGVLFILAVMLERKKLFIERDIQQDPSGQKRIIYEHRKTREIFIIPDPLLRLDQLEEVQIQVAQLLDSNPKKTSTP